MNRSHPEFTAVVKSIRHKYGSLREACDAVENDKHLNPQISVPQVATTVGIPHIIERIKAYRAAYGCGLFEAKNAVEAEVRSQEYAAKEYASWEPSSLIAQRENYERILDLLIHLARCAYDAMDNSEVEPAIGPEVRFFQPYSDELEKALEALDDLPEHLIRDVYMTGPRKAEFLLKGK